MDNLYSSLEERYGLPEGTLSAVENVESGGKDTAVSPKGAKGRFQFMPDTAKAYGVDTSDPISSAHGAAQYLSDLTKQYGSVQAALAHYNGGTKAGEAVSQGQEPPATETKDYLTKVTSKLKTPQDLEWTPIETSSQTQQEIPSDLEWSSVDLIPKKSNKFEKMSFGKQSLEGLQKSFRDLSLGSKQLLDIPVKEIAEKFPETTAALDKFGAKFGLPTAKESIEQTPKEILKEREKYASLMETGGGITGHIAGDIGQTVAGGLALKGLGAARAGNALLNPQTYKAATGLGAAQGALQPTLPEENKAFNIAAGGVAGTLGLGAVNAVGRVAQPIKNALAEGSQKAINILKEAGVPLDAAQATGSALLHRVKASLMDNPTTAGAQRDFIAKQQGAYNRAVLNTIGEDSRAATSEVMGNASKRIDNEFKTILNNNNVNLTDDIVTKIGSIQQLAIDAEKKPISNIANRILKNVDEHGQITGQSAYAIKKDLDMYASSSDTTLAHYAKELRSTLMNGINDSLSDADKEAFQIARNQFGNMKTIEGAIDKEGGGNISPSRLAQIMSTKANRAKSVYGKGNQDLVDLAQAGSKVLTEKLPNSGTIARALAQVAPGAALGAAYGAYQGDWKTAGAGALGGIALPKVIQKIINDPVAAAYLEKGLKPGVLRTVLEAPKKGQLQRIPISEFNAYLQSVPREKKE